MTIKKIEIGKEDPNRALTREERREIELASNDGHVIDSESRVVEDTFPKGRLQFRKKTLESKGWNVSVSDSRDLIISNQ